LREFLERGGEGKFQEYETTTGVIGGGDMSARGKSSDRGGIAKPDRKGEK